MRNIDRFFTELPETRDNRFRSGAASVARNIHDRSVHERRIIHKIRNSSPFGHSDDAFICRKKTSDGGDNNTLRRHLRSGEIFFHDHESRQRSVFYRDKKQQFHLCGLLSPLPVFGVRIRRDRNRKNSLQRKTKSFSFYCSEQPYFLYRETFAYPLSYASADSAGLTIFYR